MNAAETNGLLRIMEQRIEAQVVPLRERIAELETEVARLKAADRTERPGMLWRVVGAAFHGRGAR